jgi:type II secretory ATPase GspE/PulE/Tfp pilus assembly ATPase PilB-like protein
VLQSVRTNRSITSVEEAPAVRALARIEQRATALRASDVHLEPTASGGRVRLRIDGRLSEIENVEPAVFGPLLSRLKLLGGMDIADRRQPQEGRYTIEALSRSIDARISSMPTIDGEKLVIRLLDKETLGPRLDDLGMPSGLLERYQRMIASPYGFVIVSGPTGSGKTTTLYASLCEIQDDTRSICTVEDPVEMRLTGIAQVNVNQRSGLDFATVIRSFLRQDPNIIMVGEMRDTETATVAIRAALSGQLVMTTLHSNDAPRAIERLIDLGADRHAMAAAISGIVSQRLVRRLCRSCRQQDSEAVPPSYIPVGCELCGGSGYLGRTGIFELLEIGDEEREVISLGASIVQICKAGKRLGYEPLFVDGMTKVGMGETTAAEVRRVAMWPT